MTQGQSIVRFGFDTTVPMDEVAATLRLAQLAVESLHGVNRVRREARATVDRAARACVIETGSEVGRALALVFGGYIRREFGDAAVQFTTGEPGMSVSSLRGAGL